METQALLVLQIWRVSTFGAFCLVVLFCCSLSLTYASNEDISLDLYQIPSIEIEVSEPRFLFEVRDHKPQLSHDFQQIKALSQVPLGRFRGRDLFLGLQVTGKDQDQIKGLLTAKQRLSQSIETEYETGFGLKNTGFASYFAGRGYLDYQALELKTQIDNSLEAKEGADSFWRSLSGQAQGSFNITLRGLGFLPADAELKTAGLVRYRYGPAFSLVSEPPVFAMMNLTYSSAFINQDAAFSFQAYADSEQAYKADAVIDWYAYDSQKWRQSLKVKAKAAQFTDTSFQQSQIKGDWLEEARQGYWRQAFAQIESETQYQLSDQLILNVTPTFRQSLTSSKNRWSLEAGMNWQVSDNWSFLTKAGPSKETGGLLEVSAEPSIKFSTNDWSAGLFARTQGNLEGSKRDIGLAKWGGSLSLFKALGMGKQLYISAEASFDQKPDKRYEPSYGLILDIRH